MLTRRCLLAGIVALFAAATARAGGLAETAAQKALELLGAKVDYENGTVLAPDGRLVQVRVFPASTDPKALRQLLQSAAVNQARQDNNYSMKGKTESDNKDIGLARDGSKRPQ